MGWDWALPRPKCSVTHTYVDARTCANILVSHGATGCPPNGSQGVTNGFPQRSFLFLLRLLFLRIIPGSLCIEGVAQTKYFRRDVAIHGGLRQPFLALLKTGSIRTVFVVVIIRADVIRPPYTVPPIAVTVTITFVAVAGKIMIGEIFLQNPDNASTACLAAAELVSL